MIEYLLLAIAFAIMIHFRYILEVLNVIKDLRIHLNIEHEKNPFKPIAFSMVFFLFCSTFMPVMFIYIFGSEREIVIKDISGAILKSYFQLEEK